MYLRLIVHPLHTHPHAHLWPSKTPTCGWPDTPKSVGKFDFGYKKHAYNSWGCPDTPTRSGWSPPHEPPAGPPGQQRRNPPRTATFSGLISIVCAARELINYEDIPSRFTRGQLQHPFSERVVLAPHMTVAVLSNTLKAAATLLFTAQVEPSSSAKALHTRRGKVPPPEQGPLLHAPPTYQSRAE